MAVCGVSALRVQHHGSDRAQHHRPYDEGTNSHTGHSSEQNYSPFNSATTAWSPGTEGIHALEWII